jgi:hypothetical protein
LNGVFPVARFGATAWVWTIGFFAGALYFGWRTLDAISGGRAPDTYDVGAGLLLIAFIIISWARSVRRYRVADGNLYIDKRVLGKVTLPLDSIRRIEVLGAPVSFFNTGILSTGGLFGWAGKTQLRKSSDQHALQAELYGTNPEKVVIVGLTNDQTYALTPTDPDGLVAAVRAGMKAPEPEENYLLKGGRRTRKGRKS